MLLLLMANFDLVRRIHNDRDELVQLMTTVEEFGARHQLTAEVTYAAELAVEELVMNTISYGCEDGGPHAIELRMGVYEGALHMEIEDDATPFNPLSAPDPQALQGAPPEKEGGLGIFLVRECMDEVTYHEKNGGNLLILKKSIASNGAA